jgi:hypothetical protein
MKRTLSFLALFICHFYLNAQVFYPQDSLAYRYKHETIHLQSSGYVKDGNIIPYGSQRANLRAELERNGNFESIDQFKKSRKFMKIYTAFTVLGSIASFFLLAPVFATPSVGGVLLFLLALSAVALLSSTFQRKSFDFLNRAVWFYNQYVVFKK